MRTLSGIFVGLILLFTISCSTKKVLDHHDHDENMEEFTFDPIDITDDQIIFDSLPKVYRGFATMHYDILHTKLNLRFDWKHSHVLGQANLRIKPYFRSIDSLVLDAVGFDIHTVSLSSGKLLPYRYNGSNLVVRLDKNYTRTDTFDLFIEYTAKPDENPISGSGAITSDKGLFFINPKGIDPDLPTQIWTQGETENNSRWFPTFDKPNERFSQEIIMTVDDKYMTLSNGLLISSKKNPDGTRTDYWKQDKAHAPYLAMIAVGEFHEEKDEWNGIPISYIVDPQYGKYAKQIFNHTPEMLTFFSTILDYPYPWDKYSQIIVHEYVSGAMENTGAVVFGDFVQKTDRELIDEPNDEIIAHEMMHHWFGDLVTCEDWSNLTLNEGFANYAEYLWLEHKYGADQAEFHRLMSTYEYFQETYYGKSRPIINYYYTDKESMFDRHSYNKGGLVLHMLRKYLGDEAFYAGLNKYLTDHAGTAVELDELRMAFEDTVGEDLNWFFNQWFLDKGHPHIEVDFKYDNESKSLHIHTDQSETPDNFYQPFRIPVDVAVYYADGSVSFHPITVTELDQEFTIENLKGVPVNYVFDGHNVLLAIITEHKTEEQYISQFHQSSNFIDKMESLKNVDNIEKLIPTALIDSFYFFRTTGIEYIADSIAIEYVDKLQEMVMTDPDSRVRRSALVRLLNIEDYDPLLLCRIIISTEKAYPVLEIALHILGVYDTENISKYFDQFKNEESDYLVSTLITIIPDDSEAYLDFLDTKAKTISLKYINDFYNSYFDYLGSNNMKVIERAINTNASIANPTNGSKIRKLYAINTLVKLSAELINRQDDIHAQIVLDNVLTKIREIAINETDPELKDLPVYKNFR